jgi:protein-L-isoaspartate(D-aspartate) O-methyltransferase
MSSSPEKPPKFPLRLERLTPVLKTVVVSPVARLSSSTKVLSGNRSAAVVPLNLPPAVSRVDSHKMAANRILMPQAPLRHAQQVRERAHSPSGLGMDSVDVRRRMVQRLRQAGVRDDRVLAAFGEVPRHTFVDDALVTQAYEDTSLPIGHAQTISKPSVVARMMELLMQGANAQASQSLGKVLEIGTGCGYQAALLCQMARFVISIERLKPLHDKAARLLSPQRPLNLRLVYGDGMRGHPPNAPYDSIISAAGAEQVPPSWLDQLAVGGRLVAPVSDSARGRGGLQKLVVIDKTEKGWTRNEYEGVLFVPLKSGIVGETFV